MKQIKLLIVCLLGVVALTGCSVSQEGEELSTETQSVGQTEEQVEISPESDNPGTDLTGPQIRLSFEGGEAIVRLNDSAAAQNFVSQLPMTQTFEDFNGIEKICRLSEEIPTEGAEMGIDPSVANVTLYAPWNTLVFYYEDYGYNDNLIPMGHVESGMELLAAMGDEFEVTMELVDEELVGKALKDVRHQVVIATKMGVSHNADRSLKLDSRPETIRKSVEDSLKRMGTDYIDLYYQHRIDSKVEPEVVAETMAQLIKEGKIRYWGISETTEEYLRRANAVCRVTAIENRYSMMARWHESIFPVCEELNVGYVAFSPMANGFLTGKYTPDTKFEGENDYRANMPQYTKEGYEKAEGLLKLLTELSEKKNATAGQLSLAWMLCKKPYIVPIPGSRKIERLKENFEAGDNVLTPEEISMIDEKLDTMQFEVFGGHSSK